MKYLVPRTCTEIREDGNSDYTQTPSSRPLEVFRDDCAYVLLGDPGAGKTEAFRNEAQQEGCCYVTARDFIMFQDRPEWRDKTLFIDGLDEVRAGHQDKRESFDKIRAGLWRLGCPRFRLSCRGVDWFGAYDKTELEKVAQDKRIKVLRLDPLSYRDVFKILLCNHNLSDPELFIGSAQDKGIDVLLKNPQSLKMLAIAVDGEQWPKSRAETFELACRKLVREHNQEHVQADYPGIDDFQLLDAAGRLCAIQLLSGRAGYSLTTNETNDECINVREVYGEDQKIFHNVLNTKLFESPGEGFIVPVHRQVAEFLAGLYLAKPETPFIRILALVTGYDGRVVSDLRGLSAWLAVHSRKSREEIVRRDPLGTVVYGDVRNFLPEEKLQILNFLKQEQEKNPWFLKTVYVDSRLADLGTPDMEVHFREFLTDSSKDDAKQSFVVFLLEILQYLSDTSKFTDILVDIVRDDTWWPITRHRALDALAHQEAVDGKIPADLTNLLKDINDGTVSDLHDELLGRLLVKLYPDFLSASDVWQYFRTPRKTNLLGKYALFWIKNIAEQSTNTQFAKLVVEFVRHFDRFLEEYKNNKGQFHLFSEMRSLMLPRFLEIIEEDKRSSHNRLFDWLWIASDSEFSDIYEEKKMILHWMDKHPEAKKVLFKTGMERGIAPDSIYLRFFYRLGISPPPDFGLWCLENAINTTDEKSREFSLYIVVDAIKNHKHNKDISQEVVERKLAKHPALKKKFINMLSCDLIMKQPQDEEQLEEPSAEEQKQQQDQIDYVRPHGEALLENRCPPHILHHLANVYFGEVISFAEDNPAARLRNFLGGDENLVNAVLKGFKGSIARSDVPSEEEIIRFRENNETHYLALPFLAGLEEIFQNMSESDETLINEKQIRQALAFYYNAPLPVSLSNHQPAWYQNLLKHNPDTVSDVLIRTVSPQIRNRQESIMDLLYRIAFEESHAEIARLVTLPLLEKFPARCNAKQIEGLSYLLTSTLFRCNKEQFLTVVDKKLSYRSMTIAHRVYWMAAGFFALSTKFHNKLEQYIKGHEHRVRYLCEFMAKFPDKLIGQLNVQELELLIRLIGSSSGYSSLSPQEALGLLVKHQQIKTPNMHRPSDSEDFSWVSSRTEAIHLVHRLIQQLASIQCSSATDAFERLLSNNALISWKPYLTGASGKQKLLHRDAVFHHRNVNQVLQTLDNGEPANAADLAALTADVLNELAINIRNGPTSDWRQYWNMDRGKPSTPRFENFCRDALLSDLRVRLDQLGIGVTAHQEHTYADDKRSDICVEYNGYNVPVEIKKSNHEDLWNSAKNQLIAKYTKDPGTDGYGIYLVFWFGKDRCKKPEARPRPETADELKKLLYDNLTNDQKCKISICVIDVEKY